MVKSSRVMEIEFEVVRRGFGTINDYREVSAYLPFLKLPRESEEIKGRFKDAINFSLDKLDGV